MNKKIIISCYSVIHQIIKEQQFGVNLLITILWICLSVEGKLVAIVNSPIIKYKPVNKSHTKMKQLTLNENELSSDEDNKPFIGKYHQVLRNRKNQQQTANQSVKPKYKRKKVGYKTLISLYQNWKIEMPLSQKHVYNFNHIFAINQYSMRNPECEESFLATKFYMKKIKKVTIHQKSVLFQLEDLEEPCTPIPYICERLRSFGDSKFLEMALTLEHLEETLSEIEKKLHNRQGEDGQQLEGFLNQMNSKLFFSQYSPNLLVISEAMLDLLGYNVEEFAIESIKYKSILYEFFSAENYAGVIHKHIENIELLRDYLEGRMDLDQFCRRSLMVYNDCLYNRSNKKIKCEFYAGTSKQLKPYIEIKKIANDEQQSRATAVDQGKRKQIEEFKQAHSKSEIQLLKKLIEVPKQLDPKYSDKVCSYRILIEQE